MSPSTPDQTPGQAELSRKLAQLRRSYLKRLSGTLINVRRLEALLDGGFFPPGDVQLFYRLSHDYAGSGATFGFPGISTAARALHNALKDFQSGEQDVAQPRFQVLEKLRAFEQACRDAIEKSPSANDPLPSLKGDELSALPPTAKFVGVIPARSGGGEELVLQLRHYGYRADIFGDKPAQWPADRPQAIVAFGVIPAAAASQEEGRIPMIVAGGDDKFDARLNAVRAGAGAYFTGPPDILKIIEKIELLSATAAENAAFSILIVDDDTMLTEFYEHALRAAGMKTTAVANPKDCLKIMADQAFDLIVMDFSMPGCDGQELARIIRQHDAFVSMPIVFMSAKTNIQDMLIDSGLGIDAFLVKPFSPEQLVSVVRSRARRAADLRALMVRDSFTGLLNHASFIEALTTEHHAQRRTGRDTAYAMIDLDKFKSINDTYGHAAGDTVIKTLARLLKYQLRRSDIVGRCGGEEFGIIMPDCSLDNAKRILENLLAKFSELTFDFDGKEVSVTFSGGLVALDGGAGLDREISETDKALYRAKTQGRNRICVSGLDPVMPVPMPATTS